MSNISHLITPVQLGKKFGHNDGNRPGITVRRYLRKRCPNHLKNARWELTAEQAEDVRAHLRGRSA